MNKFFFFYYYFPDFEHNTHLCGFLSWSVVVLIKMKQNQLAAMVDVNNTHNVLLKSQFKFLASLTTHGLRGMEQKND